MGVTIQKKGAMFTLVDSGTEESVGEYFTRREAVKHLRMTLGFGKKKSPREALEQDKDKKKDDKKAKDIEDAKDLSGLKKAEEDEDA